MRPDAGWCLVCQEAPGRGIMIVNPRIPSVVLLGSFLPSLNNMVVQGGSSRDRLLGEPSNAFLGFVPKEAGVPLLSRPNLHDLELGHVLCHCGGSA